MNQLCRVCGEPAAGFHFGAFTCEGCKSFFGRTYNNLGSISECKNNGKCVITKKNRTSCKACRLRKCLVVGMSKSGSRYGRRSNWFKIHCLLQEQQQSQLPMLPSKNKGWEGLPYQGNHDVDNNNSTSVKDAQEKPSSPMMMSPIPGYSSMETAAALWAARSSLLPLHPHTSGLPFFPPPFFQNSPFPHPPPQNITLLPFMPLRPPPIDNSTAVLSESSSSSTSSPSPTVERRSSCGPVDTSYDNSLAVFRSFGPMQDSPMDLSFSHSSSSSKRDRVSVVKEVQHRYSNVALNGQEGNLKDEPDDVLKKSPLDLTCSKS